MLFAAATVAAQASSLGKCFLQGATDGSLMYSPDGVSWGVISNTAMKADGVGVANLSRSTGGLWACLGGGNKVYYSTDGVNWTRVPANAAVDGQNWSQVGALGTNTLVLLAPSGGSSKYLRSTDFGASWSDVTNNVLAGLPGSGNGGRTWPYQGFSSGAPCSTLITGGNNSTNDQNFANNCRSTDGNSWSPGSGMWTGSQSPYGNGGNNPAFAHAGGALWYGHWDHTADGSFWSSFFRSTDGGATWSQGLSGGGYDTGPNFATTNVDSSVTLLYSGGALRRATDTWNFNAISNPVGGISGLSFGNGRFVVVNGSSAAHSVDGSSWTNFTLPATAMGYLVWSG